MLQSELDGKRVVVALGGNALGETPGEQLKLLENTSKNLAHMVKEGINVVVTHGNGPQVGIIDEAFEVASKDKDAQVPPMPLSDCNAMSQGYIGAQLSCALRNEFRRQDIMREVANVPTHVVVDADDPAFKGYEKPIGAFMTETEARAFAKATGYQVREDSGRGWRRVVPSPVPQDIVELETIRDLMEDGCVVPAGKGDGSVAEILAALSLREGKIVLSVEPHLTAFVGLSALQSEEVRHKYSYPDAFAAFAAAVDALKAILKNLGYHEKEGEGIWTL